ncbi:MAG: DUF29 domain-containing protein [Candidatus Schekmanbacteria bacterium]|nr:DUF29 domain-containing protein [Candidatus Schekmanbacteria bacterium]
MRERIAYDQDFFAWTQATADALRQGQLDGLDMEHLADEIESMGKRDRRELLSRLSVLLAHLLKWQFQSEHQSRSWRLTIGEQRRQITELLKDSPSFGRLLPEMLPGAYEDARERALLETGLSDTELPVMCPYQLVDVLAADFLPQNS